MEPNEAFIREKFKSELPPHQVDRLIRQFGIHNDYRMTEASAKRLKKLNSTPKKQRTEFKKSTSSSSKHEWKFKMVLIGDISNKSGIYKIKFGAQYFYIGRTYNIGIRMKQHSTELFKYYLNGKWNRRHYFCKIFSFLQRNPELNSFEVELLEECDTKKELFKSEIYWLNKNRRNKYCLNLGFPELKINQYVTY